MCQKTSFVMIESIVKDQQELTYHRQLGVHPHRQGQNRKGEDVALCLTFQYDSMAVRKVSLCSVTSAACNQEVACWVIVQITTVHEIDISCRCGTPRTPASFLDEVALLQISEVYAETTLGRSSRLIVKPCLRGHMVLSPCCGALL
ncbi:uncharacterized protein MEPE_06387 [Melanopsichium pennsylvanicum]|uniref:Uncharacterized protein n=1 Tax=Melanopsichium pennsylvanicum TaxID=63383 RepID=A0AAJ5C871_9BASI|nr:uncharacterized protein MEPE_06387 [Melanopsichium pennsylvanicum]